VKKILSLLLLIPLTTIAAEHGDKAMQNKVPAQQASEHGGKAMGTKEQAGKAAEHGGKAMETKEQAAEQADTAAEHVGDASKKKASEHAGKPVE